MNNKINDIIPFFKNSSNDLIDDFNKNHIFKKIPKGQFIAMEGENCNYLPIVKSGIVRVYKLSPNGQEMTLYRIHPGESCILTISCLLTKRKFPAVAFTEIDSEVLLVEAKTLKRWLNNYNLWREFIFNYMSNIIFKVINLLEETTFSRTETRITDFLLERAKINGSELKLTHQQIASEIGTSREVVSRILKELEYQGALKLFRGNISILDVSKLQKKNLTIN